MTFLQQLIQHVRGFSDIDFKDIAIIMPNQRAKRLLQNELQAQIKTTTFLPTIFSINDFIESMSSRKKLSETELIMTLFTVYQRFTHSRGKSFAAFVSWAPLFLQDINEIDMQLATASNIFCDLSNIQELKTSFLKENLSQNQQNYLAFYKILADIYAQFNAQLAERGAGYEGSIYRQVAENIAELSKKYNFEKYIFAGFNAFSPAETQILHFYHQKQRADFYFDVDKFYFYHDEPANFCFPIHDFMKQLKLENVQNVGDFYHEIEKKITVTGVSNSLGQVLYVADLLKVMPIHQRMRTALVFADEALLLPFMHAYNCKHANLTMGYPLYAMPEYNLLEILLKTSKNIESMQKNSQNLHILIYYKDALAFYQNPIVKSGFENSDDADNFVKSLIEKNKIFLQQSALPASGTISFPQLSVDGRVMLQTLIDFFTALLENEKFSENGYIALIIRELRKICTIFESFPAEMPIELTTLEFFITKQIRPLKVSLRGDAEQGLQIMGMLETRNLDFENIILVAANEGVLPFGKTENSLLFYDVKRHYKLPTYKEKDAIYAYHFFRMLQRAKNVHLVYNNDSSKNLAEKSRFIAQLEFEIQKQKLSDTIHLTHQNLTVLPSQNPENQQFTVEKDDEICQILRTMRYSPSKLNTFLLCPLHFYLRYVAHIEPPKEVNEDVDKSVIGSVIHQVLEELVNKIKAAPHQFQHLIDDTEQQLDTILRQKFNAQHFDNQEIERGKIFLAFQVTKKYLTAYLKTFAQELSEKPFDFVGTEIELNATLNIDNQEVRLYGLTDRVDCIDGDIAILDYKTGKVDVPALTLPKEMEQLCTNTKMGQLFQLLCYAFMYKNDQSAKTVRKTANFRCGIISFQSLVQKREEYVHFVKNGSNYAINDAILDDFELILVQLFAEIFDESKPFIPTDDDEICRFCDYKIICNKGNGKK